MENFDINNFVPNNPVAGAIEEFGKFIFNLPRNGKQTLEPAEIKVINDIITNVTVDLAYEQNCDTSTAQFQDVILRNLDNCNINRATLNQNTEITQDCFQINNIKEIAIPRIIESIKGELNNQSSPLSSFRNFTSDSDLTVRATTQLNLNLQYMIRQDCRTSALSMQKFVVENCVNSHISDITFDQSVNIYKTCAQTNNPGLTPADRNQLLKDTNPNRNSNQEQDITIFLIIGGIAIFIMIIAAIIILFVVFYIKNKKEPAYYRTL